jgi:hypothetical protein
MPRHPSDPSKPAKKPSKKTSKASLTDQLRELPTDVLVDLIERHAKTVPALKQEMMRLVGNDKTVIKEIYRGIKKLSAVRPNTRSRPKEIQIQLVGVLELIKHVAIRRPHEAFPLLCDLLEDASNVAGSFSQTSVVATFFQETLPAVGTDVIARCTDLDIVRNELRALVRHDPFGTKAHFLQSVGAALSEDFVKELRKYLTGCLKPRSFEWAEVNEETIGLIKALDVAVGNVAGYEKAAGLQGPLSLTDALVLAQMCLDHDAFDDANAWLDKIPHDESFPVLRAIGKRRDALYVQVGMRSGSTDHAITVLYRRLMTMPSSGTVEVIRTIVGDDGTARILRDAAVAIAAQKKPDPRVMLFYVNNGFDDIMEERMFKPLRTSELDLDMMLPLVEAFQAKRRLFGAIHTGRWFVGTVLETASIMYYYRACHLLLSDAKLCAQAKDLRGIETSEAFEERLRTEYKTKTAFWRDVDIMRQRHYY